MVELRGANDLAGIVDAKRLRVVILRVEGSEVGQTSFPPHEGLRRGTVGVRIAAGAADDLALAVDARRLAELPAGERTNLARPAILPEEGVPSAAPGVGAPADHHASIIDRRSAAHAAPG